jgi:polysaccharide export outer membrane protein
MQRALAGSLGLLRSSLLNMALVASVLFAGVVAQEKPAAPQPNQTNSAPMAEPAQPAVAKTDSPDKGESGFKFGPMRLGLGDLLEVSVFNVPELSAKARVSNTGDIYLPLIDYLHVADLTTEEAQALIEKRLSDGGFVKNPHVTLAIVEYSSEVVTVLGEVNKPGPYPVMGERRLYDVISAAGGLTQKAGRTVTISHRAKPDDPITVPLATGLTQNAESNVPVRPGDTIIVQRAGIVYVVGDVGRPSGLLMDSDHFTVLKAVAMAGGTNRTAKLNDAKILRQTPQGIQETPISLKKILQAKAPDMPLQAEDILFVPSSAGKVALYRGSEAIVQAAVGMSIYAAPRP